MTNNDGPLGVDFIKLLLRFFAGITSGKVSIIRRRDTSPLRSLKRIGLLFTARITTEMSVK